MRFVQNPDKPRWWVTYAEFRGWTIKFRIEDDVRSSSPERVSLAKATLARLDPLWPKVEQAIVGSLLADYNKTCAKRRRPECTDREFITKFMLEAVETMCSDDSFKLDFAHAGLFEQRRVTLYWWLGDDSFDEVELSDDEEGEEDAENEALMQQHAICRVVATDRSDYGHFFGGSLLHQDARYEEAEAPFQLLFSFNTKDPSFPLELDLPGMGRIVLYYPFYFNCPDVFYRAFDDGSMVVFEAGNEAAAYDPDFPYPGFPSEFPQTPVSFEWLADEEMDIVMAADTTIYSSEFDEREQAVLAKLGHPFFTRVGTSHNLLQGAQAIRCFNPDCPEYDGEWGAQLFTFATVWNNPVPGVSLWGEQHCQLVYDVCPACGFIHGYNRSS
jgi:hypothetical protein